MLPRRNLFLGMFLPSPVQERAAGDAALTCGETSTARPEDTNWTGAEIKSCCGLASLMDVPLVQATQNVVPVAVTAGDEIEGLREGASGRCLSADRAGV